MLDAARLVLLALAAAVVAATLLPLATQPHWWVRMFDFPRAQITAVALVVLALHAWAALAGEGLGPLDWSALVALGACVVYQAARMAPYTPLYPTQSARAEATAEGRRLCVVVSNVLMHNRDLQRWAAVVRAAEPDLVAVVETDAWWVQQVGEVLADYPHRVEVPQEDTYGMAVFSRFPLHQPEVRHLVEPTIPSIFAQVELPAGDRVQLVLLHPRPPRPDIQQGSEFRDAELALAAAVVRDLPRPVLVAGDLNDVAWSRTTRRFQKLAGLLDPRVGRGLFSTFHADHVLLRYPLDHVFHSPELALVALRRLGHVGSDHFPMMVEVALAPEARAAQAAPRPEAEDVEEAAEAIEMAVEVQDEETPAERREREREDQ